MVLYGFVVCAFVCYCVFVCELRMFMCLCVVCELLYDVVCVACCCCVCGCVCFV